jgi:hypothetical protein
MFQQCCAKQSTEFSFTVACLLLQRVVASEAGERELLGFPARFLGSYLRYSIRPFSITQKSLMESFRFSEAEESGPNGADLSLYERNYFFLVPSPVLAHTGILPLRIATFYLYWSVFVEKD